MLLDAVKECIAKTEPGLSVEQVDRLAAAVVVVVEARPLVASEPPPGYGGPGGFGPIKLG